MLIHKKKLWICLLYTSGKDGLRERGSLLAMFFVLSRVFSMANDNSRKFKQNQIIVCIQAWIVDYSRPIVFSEDRLRERGSLPATFYVLTRVIFYMTNDNCRNVKHNEIICCTDPYIVEISRPVSYTHLDVYKRQLPHIQTESNNFLHTSLNCRELKAFWFWWRSVKGKG